MLQKEYIEKLESVIVDLLDGDSYYYDIHNNTGLPIERCIEIQAFFCECVLPNYKKMVN